MTENRSLSEPAEGVKSCCAGVYESDWARLLLGDSFHPGGLALTERLGELLSIGPHTRVLDVAAGKGTSGVFLARRLGCRVVGVDYGAVNVAEAARAAAEAGVSDRVSFVQGDAECLPFADGEFDAIVCECAYCTFPNKTATSREFHRVVRPGGRLGLADLTRSGTLTEELNTLLGWVACLGDAQPVDEYARQLEVAGFTQLAVESHDEALSRMVHDVRAKLLAVELMTKLGKIMLPVGNIDQAKEMARTAASCVQDGRLGYSLLTALRP